MNYIYALILTIIIELSVIYLLGFREKLLFYSLIIINILTNPLLNFIVNRLNETYIDFNFLHIILLEILVVIIEWLLLKLVIKSKQLPLFKISFIINSTSFLIGLWI